MIFLKIITMDLNTQDFFKKRNFVLVFDYVNLVLGYHFVIVQEN